MEDHQSAQRCQTSQRNPAGQYRSDHRQSDRERSCERVRPWACLASEFSQILPGGDGKHRLEILFPAVTIFAINLVSSASSAWIGWILFSKA